MQTDEREPPSLEDEELRQVALQEAATDTHEEPGLDLASDDTQAQRERQRIYIMVPKTYSESVYLRDDGPQSTVEYNSSCCYGTPQTYVTQAEIVPRLIPKYYITAVRVKDDGREDTVTYHERVEFVYTQRIKEFSETVNSFPKEVSRDFVTTLTYDPNSIHRHYISSLVMEPTEIVELPVNEDVLDGFDMIDETAAAYTNEQFSRSNYEEEYYQEQQQPVLLNGTA